MIRKLASVVHGSAGGKESMANYWPLKSDKPIEHKAWTNEEIEAIQLKANETFQRIAKSKTQ